MTTIIWISIFKNLFQIYEKLISGMYLGELTRLLILDIIQKDIIFGGIVPSKLQMKGSFPTWYISQVRIQTL